MFSDSLRYVRSFCVLDDAPFYVGTMDAYTLLDLGVGIVPSGRVNGLRLDVSAQNVLNNRHREYIGVPMVGRLVTGRLTYAF